MRYVRTNLINHENAKKADTGQQNIEIGVTNAFSAPASNTNLQAAASAAELLGLDDSMTR